MKIRGILTAKLIFPFLLFWLTMPFTTCHRPTDVAGVSKDFSPILESDLDYAIVKTDGTVWTWGGNSTGQIGNGTMAPSAVPDSVEIGR